jgi:quinol monooxygenase YgiN
MNAVIVRYRVKPGRSEENADLVRSVYAGLEAEGSAGFRYATFVLDDGVSFVHIAFSDDGESAPLVQLPAFQEFQRGIAERCDEQPQVTRLTTRIGSYAL